MTARVLAIDFGTSNSAVAVLDGAAPQRIAIEDGNDTLPTAVFFPENGGSMCIGHAAGQALIDGESGRYMRALKSILGTSLFHQSRLIEGRRRTLAEVVTAFLAEIKRRAEARAGERYDHVLSGRPVHFHTADRDRDARAEDDLRGCYRAAGFVGVRFLHEPEAAALASHGLGREGETGLIVDIGGGTSDFSVFRTTGSRIEILASHGIRLGGTDFDQKISTSHVMPLLGQGGELRRAFGSGLLPVPNAIYQDLATWAKIPFLYNCETERTVDDLLRHAVDPARIIRLRTVIGERLGHDLAFAVEHGKIAANAGPERGLIEIGQVEPGLAAPIDAWSMNAALAGFRTQLRTAMAETLARADTSAGQIGTAILVGGSSLMKIVVDEVEAACPAAQLQQSAAFTAVVDGLALATAEHNLRV